jgi:hypothetical protein
LDEANLFKITWATITNYIKTFAAEGDSVSDLITFAACLHRAAGTSLFEWLQSLVATEARLRDVKIDLPQAFWSGRAWSCMTPYERALLKQHETPLKNLKQLSADYSRSALKSYPQAEAKRTRLLIPCLPDADKKGSSSGSSPRRAGHSKSATSINHERQGLRLVWNQEP